MYTHTTNITLYVVAGIFFSIILGFSPLLGVVVLILIGLLLLTIFQHKEVVYFILAFCCGCLYVWIYTQNTEEIPETITTNTATLFQAPSVRTDKTFLAVTVNHNEETYKARISVPSIPYCPIYSDIYFPESIVLKKPEPFLTETGFFAYDKYLSARNIAYVGYARETQCIEKTGTFSFLFNIKEYFVKQITQIIHEPYASFLLGITIGEKGSLPTDIQEDFKKTSLTHILVLSGYNITILIVALTFFLIRIPLHIRVFLLTLSILSFVLVTGLEVPTLRAALMGIISIWAIVFGRVYDVTRALVIIAALFALYNPEIVAYDASFHLSFVATAGLLLFTEKIEEIIKRVPDYMRLVIATSLAAQIAVLPYIVHISGDIPIVGVLSNTIILPCIPLFMLFTFLTAATSNLFFIGDIIAKITSVGTNILLHTVSFLANIPFGNIPFITIPSSYLIVLYAGALFYITTILYRKEKQYEEERDGYHPRLNLL